MILIINWDQNVDDLILFFVVIEYWLNNYYYSYYHYDANILIITKNWDVIEINWDW